VPGEPARADRWWWEQAAARPHAALEDIGVRVVQQA
jgi:hypothetical protein